MMQRSDVVGNRRSWRSRCFHSLPSDFPTTILYAFHISPIRVRRYDRLILNYCPREGKYL